MNEGGRRILTPYNYSVDSLFYNFEVYGFVCQYPEPIFCRRRHLDLRPLTCADTGLGRVGNLMGATSDDLGCAGVLNAPLIIGTSVVLIFGFAKTGTTKLQYVGRGVSFAWAWTAL